MRTGHVVVVGRIVEDRSGHHILVVGIDFGLIDVASAAAVVVPALIRDSRV